MNNQQPGLSYVSKRSDWATKNSDGTWPIHFNARHVPRKAHTAKKIIVIKPTLH